MNWWKPENWTIEGVRSALALGVGVVTLIIFVLVVQFMLERITVEEKQWTRAVYVFSGVEALAFSAAGFFFGSQVHRERAEKAEQRASKAEQDTAKGKFLADLVEEKAERVAGARASFEASILNVAPSQRPLYVGVSDESLAELAAFARKLFP